MGADVGCSCGLSHSQLPPLHSWHTWYIRGGRGSGKTRTGAETLAEWIREWIFRDPKAEGEWAIVAPTFGDARDVCMEGPSGLLRQLAPLIDRRRDWNRSMGELWLPNGARVFCDGADDGAYRVQGKNLRGAWCDEIGLWRRWEDAWNESLAFAVRLEPGQIVATGTPKMGHPLVKLLLNDPAVIKTHMRLVDNIDNLPADLVQALYEKYKGLRIGRQELEGEFLEEVEGAFWTLVQLDQLRVSKTPALDRVVVGVDPAASAKKDSDETGIVGAGKSNYTQNGYVLADRSLVASPERWARTAINLYHELQADMIVAEKNNGGDMVRHTLYTVDSSVPVKLVWASRGKRTRAEPVAALYEQRRIFHHGVFRELEEQMCSWTPDDSDSPDRMDALVWALTELCVEPRGGGQVSYLPSDREVIIRRGDLTLIGEHHIDKER